MGRGGPNRGGARADRRSGGVKKDQFVKHGRQEQIPQQYEKVRGTKLHKQGDSWVRVVGATGKVFQPNDLAGVHQHLDKIAAQGNDFGEQQQQRRRGRGSPERKGKGSGKGEREAQRGKGFGKGEQKGRNSGKGNRGDGPQYEKVKGTQIRRLDNGEVVRYVPESGKSFQPNDLKTVYEHLDRLGASQAKAPWREERGQSEPGGRRRSRGGRKNMYPQYEKIKGTSIQEMDGEVVRFVRESGRTFQPNDLQGVHDHIDKLQRHSGSGKGKGKKGGGAMMALPGPSPKGGGKGSRNKGRNTSTLALPAPGRVKKQFLKQERDREGMEPRRRKGRFADKVARKQQEQRGRKERKERTPEQLEAMKEKWAEQHAARCEKDGRKVLSDVWHTGEIVRRMNAFALAKPLDTFAIPLEVRNKLEIANEKRRSSQKEGGSRRQRNGDDDDDLIYLACADIAEEGVMGKGFRPPAKVQFKLYTDDKRGVGGCEIKSA